MLSSVAAGSDTVTGLLMICRVERNPFVQQLCIGVLMKGSCVFSVSSLAWF